MFSNKGSWSESKWLDMLQHCDQTFEVMIEMAKAAVWNDYLWLFRFFLLRAKFLPGKIKHLAIFTASKPEALDQLLKLYNPWLARVWVTPEGLTLLQYCIENQTNNFREVVTLPIIRKNLDAPGMDGLSPLMFACHAGRQKYFKILLKAGAKIALMTNSHQTVFHRIAMKTGNPNLLQFLKSKKDECPDLVFPDVEIRELCGNLTALHLALLNNRVAVATDLMLLFHSSASCLFGESRTLNSADMMLLRNGVRELEAIRMTTSLTPSLARLYHSYLDGSLDKPPHADSWPAFITPHSILIKEYGFLRDPSGGQRAVQEALNQLGGSYELVTHGNLQGSEICPICHDTMNEYYETLCGHRFDPQCVATWLKTNTRCPMCRHEGLEPVPFNGLDSPAPKERERVVLTPRRIKPLPLSKVIYNTPFNDIFETEFLVSGRWVSECVVFDNIPDL